MFVNNWDHMLKVIFSKSILNFRDINAKHVLLIRLVLF